MAITAAMLVDGTDNEPQPGTTVIWDGDRIVWVGRDDQARLEGAKLVDAAGGMVLPGLIDCHVHLSIDPVLTGVETIVTDSVAKVAIRSAQAAKRLHDAGITTARDMGSRDGVAVEVASAQRSGWLIGARILAAGRGVTPSGGHGWMIGVEADGPAAVAAAVRTELDRGADVIKIFPTGGVLGSGAHGPVVTMSPEEIDAAVDAAHAGGALIAAHVIGAEGVGCCLKAGVDTIEHGVGVTTEQAERMVAEGVALVPTLTALDRLTAHADELPADLQQRLAEVGTVAEDGVRRAIAAGVRVLAGTDAGTPFNPPGLLAREMQLLADLGLGAAGVVRAATSEAADVLRLDDLGIVAPGKRADLVLVMGDGLADLELLRTPRAVVQDGKLRVLA